MFSWVIHCYLLHNTTIFDNSVFKMTVILADFLSLGTKIQKLCVNKLHLKMLSPKHQLLILKLNLVLYYFLFWFIRPDTTSPPLLNACALCMVKLPDLLSIMLAHVQQQCGCYETPVHIQSSQSHPINHVIHKTDGLREIKLMVCQRLLPSPLVCIS